MTNKETIMTKLENGRADFAYKCVKGVLDLKIEDKDKVLTSEVLDAFKRSVIKDLTEKINDEKQKEHKKKLIEEVLKQAYQKLKNKKDLNDDEKKVLNIYEKLLDNYRSYARKIPQMILSNGLGQTLAFVYSKKKDGNAYDLIYRQITDYMKSDSTARITMPADEDELVKWVISLDSSKYQHATEEILAFLKWLKRFAEGMIEEEEGGEE